MREQDLQTDLRCFTCEAIKGRDLRGSSGILLRLSFGVGIVHTQIFLILSSFTHRQVLPNLYAFLYLLNTKQDILKNVGNQTVDGSH